MGRTRRARSSLTPPPAIRHARRKRSNGANSAFLLRTRNPSFLEKPAELALDLSLAHHRLAHYSEHAGPQGRRRRVLCNRSDRSSREPPVRLVRELGGTRLAL